MIVVVDEVHVSKYIFNGDKVTDEEALELIRTQAALPVMSGFKELKGSSLAKVSRLSEESGYTTSWWGYNFIHGTGKFGWFKRK